MPVLETRNWLLEFREQYRQFFCSCNWYDFTFFHFNVEWNRCMGGVEATLVVLGFSARVSYTYDHHSEMREELDRRFAEMLSGPTEIERLREDLRAARETLRDFREYALKLNGDATWVGGAHHNPIWPRVASEISNIGPEKKEPNP